MEKIKHLEYNIFNPETYYTVFGTVRKKQEELRKNEKILKGTDLLKFIRREFKCLKKIDELVYTKRDNIKNKVK